MDNSLGGLVGALGDFSGFGLTIADCAIHFGEEFAATDWSGDLLVNREVPEFLLLVAEDVVVLRFWLDCILLILVVFGTANQVEELVCVGDSRLLIGPGWKK